MELKKGEKNKKKNYEQTSLCVYRVVVTFLLWHFGQEEEPFSQKNWNLSDKHSCSAEVSFSKTA